MIKVNLDATHDTWASSGALKHLYLRGFLQEDLSSELYDDFEGPLSGKRSCINEKRYSHRNVFRKIGTQNFGEESSRLSQTMRYLISDEFVMRLRALTAIEDLHADPRFYGGGITEMFPGGYLRCHRDFNIHSGTGQYRRLNLLVYLNPVWPKEWGGGIELWSPDHLTRLAAFQGCKGDAVLFETSEISFHQVPPISRSALAPRRALALYYFSNQWPYNVDHRTSTDYQLTPTQWVELIRLVFLFKTLTLDELITKIQSIIPNPWTYQKSDIPIAYNAFMKVTENFGTRRAEIIESMTAVAASLEAGRFIPSRVDGDSLWAYKLILSLSSAKTTGDPYSESYFSLSLA